MVKQKPRAGTLFVERFYALIANDAIPNHPTVRIRPKRVAERSSYYTPLCQIDYCS